MLDCRLLNVYRLLTAIPLSYSLPQVVHQHPYGYVDPVALVLLPCETMTSRTSNVMSVSLGSIQKTSKHWQQVHIGVLTNQSVPRVVA